jgi:hypothetical protein
MITDVVSVYYGKQDVKLRDLEKTEIMPPEIPSQGDIISIDDRPYKVERRMFDADAEEISILAIEDEQFVRPQLFKP